MYNTSSKITFYVQLISFLSTSPPQPFLLMHEEHMRNKNNPNKQRPRKIKTLSATRVQEEDHSGTRSILSQARQQKPTHLPTQPNPSHYSNRLRNCTLTSREPVCRFSLKKFFISLTNSRETPPHHHHLPFSAYNTGRTIYA